MTRLRKVSVFFLISYILFSCSSESINNSPDIAEDDIYFPSINSDEWASKNITDLDWNSNALNTLLHFLEERNTKSFMMLHNGKIVVEAYLNGHSASTPWYWASAGKTLTTATVGIAQNEGLINIDQKVSDYIGTGWTSATVAQEQLITCRNLLSMTSGIDDSLGEGVAPEDLLYKADAGDRWAYHNVYLKLQDVVASASGQDWSSYFDAKLSHKIGMSGQWFMSDDFNVFGSPTRSMARFGLLIFANGRWNDEQIIPNAYLNEATNTSQELNKAYGYMWWLNGKDSFMLPGTQIQFDGELIPNAPADMFCALGKNDQKLYVVPSASLVVIRMGEAADENNFALSNFDNELWYHINNLIN